MPDVVTECGRCGEPLVVSAVLTKELDPGSVTLVHDVCPRDRRLRSFDFVLTAVEDHGDEGAEELAGFTVSVEATTLRAAVEAAGVELSEKWQRLFQTAHLADTEGSSDPPTMPELDDVRDQGDQSP